MPRTRLVFAVALPLLLFGFLLTTQFNAVDYWNHRAAFLLSHDNAISENASDATILDLLRLPSAFEFRRHCIEVHLARSLARSKLEHVSSQHRLVSQSGSVVNKDKVGVLPPCDSTIALKVPHFEPNEEIDTSSLMFGVATTLKRMNDSLSSFARWLPHGRSTVLVLLVDQPDILAVSADVDDVRTRGRDLGMTFIFDPYTGQGESEGVKNFALAQALKSNARAHINWFGLIDDDTFFVSLAPVMELLKPYDPKEQYYIGSLTEGHERLRREGFKAWGGGGFFISKPLLLTVAENSDFCQGLDRGFGDILWRDCMFEVTAPTVQLTEVRGLHQIDMWGDVSGFYESGLLPLLSVHHWKSWHLHPIPVAHMVVDVAGSESFLQRYLFEGEDVVLTNGYSIVRYPKGLPDLRLAEMTMVDEVGKHEPPDPFEFHHALGRLRAPLQVGTEKLNWRFEQGVSSEDGNMVRQFYIKRAGQDTDMDSVIELDWRRRG